jgi:uncharacterized protein (TIGR02145 family)
MKKRLLQGLLPLIVLLAGCSKTKEAVPVDVPVDFITIGTQHWMKKNLDVTTYRNGDIIPQVTDSTAWIKLTTGAWCYYNNDPANGAIYGKLYNWYAVNDARGLAPQGWHIPTSAEWNTLSTFLGGSAGGKMKTTGTSWTTPNTGATNESGFSALPGGLRSINGGFYNVGVQGSWWGVPNPGFGPFYNSILNPGTSLGYVSFSAPLPFGVSVRCLMD